MEKCISILIGILLPKDIPMLQILQLGFIFYFLVSHRISISTKLCIIYSQIHKILDRYNMYVRVPLRVRGYSQEISRLVGSCLYS